jgi:purine-nucleoside phosphorylase
VTAERDAADWIRSHAPGFTPRVGIILGSGLGAAAQSIAQVSSFRYQDIPGFPRSYVSGHAGQLILGHLQSAPVIAMQGRAHLYEGWSVEQATLPVRTMIELGISLLIVSNASGGINLRFRSGQTVLIDHHLNWMNGIRSPRNPALVAVEARSVMGVPVRTSCIYDPLWLGRAEKAAIELGFSLSRGTYLATLGPNYETRAEYRAFARMGADMVGMSTVPETIVASQHGIPTLAFSVITNVARPDAPTRTDHHEVLEWSQIAQSQLVPLIERLMVQYFS